MPKKIITVMMGMLVCVSVAMGYYWNKDLHNWSTEPAHDLAVIAQGTPDVSWHFDGYHSGHHFDDFTTFPIGGYTCLHWTNPAGGPIPVGDVVHVGASGSGSFTGVDMYWTDEDGSRLGHSVVWNADTRIRYEGGDAVICMANITAPVDEQGNLIEEPWAAPREIVATNIRYAVIDDPIPLDELNAANEHLNSILEPLVPETVIPPGGEEMFVIPEPVAEGQFVVVRWNNSAPAILDSDETEAIDWVQDQLLGAEPIGIQDGGTVEPVRLLDVASGPGGWEISYHLPKDAEVTLAIYSVTGELIVTLLNEFKSAGTYTTSWNPSEDIAVGTYFCRLKADGIQAAEKMIRLR